MGFGLSNRHAIKAHKRVCVRENRSSCNSVNAQLRKTAKKPIKQRVCADIASREGVVLFCGARRQPPSDSGRGCIAMTNPTHTEKIFLYFLFQIGNIAFTINRQLGGDRPLTA